MERGSGRRLRRLLPVAALGALTGLLPVLGGAATLPSAQAESLLDAARTAFTHGLSVASGVGALLLLSSAVAVWILLKSPGPAEVGMLADPGVHRDAGGDRRVDAPCGAELRD